MKGKCQHQGVVYRATATTETGEVKKYTGATEDFMKRHYTHDGDTKTSSRRSATALAGFIWEMKDQGVNTEVEWEFLKLCNLYKPTVEPVSCAYRKRSYYEFRDPSFRNK